LRERVEDIPVLAHYFADKQAEANRLPKVKFTPTALSYLQSLPYPGNVRELKNLVERTLLVSGKAVLDEADLATQNTQNQSIKGTLPEGLRLNELEKRSILQAIEKHAGNLSQVAAALGISRAALYRRIEKYGI
jgi:two-component system NtrC family response regulator